MTDLAAALQVLLIVWLGVMVSFGEGQRSPLIATVTNSSSVDSVLKNIFSIKKQPDMYSERLHFAGSDRRVLLSNYKKLSLRDQRFVHTLIRPTFGNGPISLVNKFSQSHHPTKSDRKALGVDSNNSSQTMTTTSTNKTATSMKSNQFLKHLLTSSLTQTTTLAQSAAVSSSVRSEGEERQSHMHHNNVGFVSHAVYNSSSLDLSTIYRNAMSAVYHNLKNKGLREKPCWSSWEDNISHSRGAWLFSSKRKISRFPRELYNVHLQSKTKNTNLAHREQKLIIQSRQLAIAPVGFKIRLIPPRNLRNVIINITDLSSSQDLQSRSSLLKSALFNNTSDYICQSYVDVLLTPTDCTLHHFIRSYFRLKHAMDSDLIQDVLLENEAMIRPSADRLHGIDRNVIENLKNQDSILYTTFRSHPTPFVSTSSSLTPAHTTKHYRRTVGEINKPVYYSTLASSVLPRQHQNRLTQELVTPRIQVNNEHSSRRTVKRSEFRTSRRKSHAQELTSDRILPASSYRSTYDSSLLSLSSATSNLPQEVSLKVIVHLSVNRGYERVLDSAIFTGNRDFRQLRRFLAPSGKLVSLKGDKPRDILLAFCDDILQSNTTAVFHLVNPFFHTRSWSSAQYVSNLLSTLDMPIITWGPEYIGTTDKKESELLQLNISPTLYHQAQAMLEVLRHYNWSHFCVVYTPVPGHDAFLTAVRILVNDNNSNVGKSGFRFDIIEQVAVSNFSDNGTISKDLKELVRTEARIILLYCMEGETLNILQVARKLNLMTEEYLWFLTFEAINKNKQLNANNLPMGMLGIYYEYYEDEMEAAIKTAVAVWFRGLYQSVMASAPANGLPTGLPWSMPNFDCHSRKSLVWEDGPKFYDIMRNVSFDNVAFNELGQLKFKDISIVNVQPPVVGEENRKWRQVGKFTTDGIKMSHITWPGETIHPPIGRPKRHVLRIVTREEPPFVEYREVSGNGTCGHFSYICQVYERDENEVRISNTTLKRCCTGLSIDFLHRLSQTLNFDFFLYEVEDYQWGAKNQDGTWDGIVGDLRSRRADMAVASMTIDEDRSSAIDFSVPYMETGITFMVAIRDGAISTTAFLEPYDYPSWCIILLCSVHITGAAIFFFEWFSPNGLDHGRRLTSTYKFSLFRTFWLMWAMLFGAAVTTDTPRGVSSKFLTNIWALFALVFTASYTANLAAFMITKEEYFDLTGMQDWRLQSPQAMAPPFRFGTMPNGTTENNIKKNNPRMFQYMKKYSQRSVEQAMDALKKQKLHAFIYDASVLEYQEGKDKDCKLITVGNWYATTGYGVGFPFGSPWLDRVNNVILNLQSEGEMERLKEFWLAGACHTKRKKNTSNRGIGHGVSSTTLGILNFTSAFIFLAAGTCLAIMTFVMEYMYFWFGRKRLSNWDKRGCCALISLSMGMSLSFQESVHEAWDAHRKSKQKCTSTTCESNLWKVNHELRLARSEISRLQAELARVALEVSNSVVWKYDPISTSKPNGEDHCKWDAHDCRDEEEAVRVTLL